jgi:hypothetical protein
MRVRFRSKGTIVAVAILVVVIVVSSYVLLVPNQQMEDNGSIVLVNSDLQDGDLFVYSMNGTYNGTHLSGTINAKYLSPSGYLTNATFSDPDFGFVFWNATTFHLLGGSIQVGSGMYMTPFGLKGVVWTFDSNGNWATICYVGADPGISYGMSVNGPNTHLTMTLVNTTSNATMDKNTDALKLIPKQVPIGEDYGGVGGIDKVGGTSGEGLFTENGAFLNYSLDATDVDVVGFSYGNIRSMAEGGPFAYDLAITKMHAGNMSGEFVIPAGYYFIYLTGHNKTAEQSQGLFHWTMTRY